MNDDAGAWVPMTEVSRTTKPKRDAVALQNALALANANADDIQKLASRVLALELILSAKAAGK